jgi:hypothetical protein
MRNRIAIIALLVAACSSPADAPQTPGSLQVTAGNNQLGVPGFLLAQPVSVTLKDGAGNPIAGDMIEFTVENDGVATVTGSAVTDASGVAQATWRAGVAIGAQQLVASTVTPPALSTTATADVRSNPVIAIAGGDQGLCAIDAQNRLGCWVPPSPDRGVLPLQFKPVASSVGFTQLVLYQNQGCALATTGRVWCFTVDSSTNVSGLAEVAGGYPSFRQLVGTSLTYCGLGAAGDAWCWGANANGQVGDGTETTQPAPVAVATATRFMQLDVANDHACGVATDSTAWCWGNNFSGMSGLPTTFTHALAPVQIQSPVHFTQVLAPDGPDMSCGLTATRGAYCWGNLDWVNPAAAPSPNAVAVSGAGNAIDIGAESLKVLFVDNRTNITGAFFEVSHLFSVDNGEIRGLLGRHTNNLFCGPDLLGDGVLCKRLDTSDLRDGPVVTAWSGVPRP